MKAKLGRGGGDMSEPNDDVIQVLGDPDAQYRVRCPTCEQMGRSPVGEQPPVRFYTDERERAKMEARDHREWHPDHRPIARGRDGERVYG